MTNSINFNIYKYSILSIKQGCSHNIRSIAKPLALLAIIECVENGLVVNNMFYFEKVEETYNHLRVKYGLTITTKVQYPFYFLINEDFYHLIWKSQPIKTKSPTVKMLRDNVDYACLDNALWDLLQDEEVRQQYKTLIIDNFLTNK